MQHNDMVHETLCHEVK